MLMKEGEDYVTTMAVKESSKTVEFVLSIQQTEFHLRSNLMASTGWVQPNEADIDHLMSDMSRFRQGSF